MVRNRTARLWVGMLQRPNGVIKTGRFAIRLKVKVLSVQNTKAYMGELQCISNFP